MIRGRGDAMDHGPQNRDHLHDGCNDPVNARVVVGVDGSDSSWDNWWTVRASTSPPSD